MAQIKTKRKRNFWTKKTALKELSRYESRKQASKMSGAYAWCLKKGINIDKVLPLKRSKKYCGTLSEAFAKISHCTSRSEVKEKFPDIHQFMYTKYKSVFWERFPTKHVHRTVSSAIKESKQYTEKKAFLKNRGLVAYIKRNPKVKDYFRTFNPSHPMLSSKNSRVEKKIEKVFEEARSLKYLDHIYRKGSPHYGLISYHKLLPKLKKILIDRGHPLSWSKKHVLEEFERYKGDLRKLKKERYAVYQRGLWLGVFEGKNKTGRKVYSQKNIDRLAKKCICREEFIVKYKAAYNTVIKYGLVLDLPSIPKVNFKGETTLRKFFEKVFRSEFKNIRPEFIRNPKTGRKLELDLYSPSLKIAVEHHGIQHYSGFFHDMPRRHYDSLKKKACKKHGIAFVVVPDIFWIQFMNEDQIKKDIKAQLMRQDVQIPKLFDSVKIFDKSILK